MPTPSLIKKQPKRLENTKFLMIENFKAF